MIGQQQTGVTYCRTFTLNTKDWGSLTVKPEHFGGGLTNGYLVVKQLGSDFVTAHKGNTFVSTPKWTTLDGITVDQQTKLYMINNVPDKITSTLAAGRTFDGQEKLTIRVHGGAAPVSWWGNNSYLVPGNETKNTKHMAYFFIEDGENSAHQWAELTPTDDSNYFSVTVPAGTWSTMVLLRVNKDCPEENYWTRGQEYMFNQTGNIPIDATKNTLETYYERESGHDGNGGIWN